ncbi:hypothetical protein MCOR22_010326 [Pyricularia oryzae]|nr:hypothetical protein MCOR01_010177 [Pyricularia oryzae]KAI6429286.1 hypothetical protein MCOR22_010326 [Pyricularia oryzae]KAI6447635.1 hypothetical protein MCOR15_010180 [Pyricularia oryzae]
MQRLFVLNPATDMTGNHSFTIFIAGASAVGPLVAYHCEETAAANGGGIQNTDARGPGSQAGSSDAKKTATAEAQE